MENKQEFPVQAISKIAEKESWRKEIYRPIYHLHKWWAQRLGTVFRAILLYLVENDENDVWCEFYKFHNYKDITILDPFMGSGTTLGEALKLGMNVVGCDINPISSFLVKQELTRVDIPQLYAEYEKIRDSIECKIRNCYNTIDLSTGEIIPVLYYFWVKFVVTSSGEEIPLFTKYIFSQNACPAKKPKVEILCPECWRIFEGKYDDMMVVCPYCQYHFNPQSGNIENNCVIDKKGQKYKIKDLVSLSSDILKEKMFALVAINKNGEKVYQHIQDYDKNLYNEIRRKYDDNNNCNVPNSSIRPGYNTNQVLGYNYSNWRDFFNFRQLYCLQLLMEEILKIEDTVIREQFLCLFSGTLEYNNMFCSFKGEGTGAVRPIFSNHILKPERMPLENSVWGHPCSSGCFSTLFKSRFIKAKQYLDLPFEIQFDVQKQKYDKIVCSYRLNPHICESWNEMGKVQQSALILNGDSAHLPIPASSIDFVVTDPPYFDYVHYSELSDFFYAWLSPVLKKDYSIFSDDSSGKENEVQNTDFSRFSRLLGNVFTESFRILKKNGKMAFSFHHSKLEGWLAIANAIKQAQFFLDETFPLYSELIVSAPKSQTKEPICLDAIIICCKHKKDWTMEMIINQAKKKLELLNKCHNTLSANDKFVIAACTGMLLCVNQRLSDSQSEAVINNIYEILLDYKIKSEPVPKIQNQYLIDFSET